MASLRAIISFIFISIFVLTLTCILLTTSFGFSQIMLFFSSRLITSSSNNIEKALSNLLDPAMLLTKLTPQLINHGILNIESDKDLQAYIKNVLVLLPQAEMSHWGTPQGEYIVGLKLKNKLFATILYRSGNFPINKDAGYTNPWISYWQEKKYAPDKKMQIKILYDPKIRPWYQAALKAKKHVWTNEYLFYWQGKFLHPGVSCAVPVYTNNDLKGVFSIDVKLNSISEFLAKHKVTKHSLSFIFDKNGTLIAFPQNYSFPNAESSPKNLTTITQLNNPIMNAVFLDFEKKKASDFMIKINNQYFLAYFRSIPQFRNYNWYIGTIVPEQDYSKGYRFLIKVISIIFILITILGLVLINIFSKKLSIPINKLARELEKIKYFDIKPSPPFRALIREVFIMSRSIESMKIGLNSFRKYLPEKLVLNLISSGEAAKIGGHSRDIALFFSDIVNFTSIAEQTEPKKILGYLCEYFEEMDIIISKHSGIIDKYIGDSIMAFWGVLSLDGNKIKHACDAALACQHRLQLFNEELFERNGFKFETRIGIHYGYAIVGNIGSLNRLNYTAIGDSVNVTSRLEQLNKNYGTKIIVSEFVYDQVKTDYFFRILDRILIRGREEPTCIYELIQSKNIPLKEYLLKFCDNYQHGFTAYQHQAWDLAIDYFKTALKYLPENKSCLLMIARCHNFKRKPPPEPWNGIWSFTNIV